MTRKEDQDRMAKMEEAISKLTASGETEVERTLRILLYNAILAHGVTRPVIPVATQADGSEIIAFLQVGNHSMHDAHTIQFVTQGEYNVVQLVAHPQPEPEKSELEMPKQPEIELGGEDVKK